MPLNDAQKTAQITPSFAGARKPMQQYIDKLKLDTLFDMRTQLGAPGFTRLVNSFFPDQLFSLKRDLSQAELAQLATMTVATLQSLGTMSADWVKSMLRVIGAPAPAVFVGGPVPLPGGIILNNNGSLDQTSTQVALLNTVVTELNAGGGATRNLIFSNAGNCVGEINFANHGGTAVSGHAHVYPVMCVPLTGHHVMGTPHVDMADYPAVWRQLPAGVNPATPLGT